MKIYNARTGVRRGMTLIEVQYCKDTLEQLRDRKFADIPLGFPAFAGSPAQSTLTENNLPLMSQGTSGQVTINGTRTTRLTNQTASSDSRYDVQITFSWQARLYRGAARTYTITLDSRLYPR
jgi:hypothetical protein